MPHRFSNMLSFQQSINTKSIHDVFFFFKCTSFYAKSLDVGLGSLLKVLITASVINCTSRSSVGERGIYLASTSLGDSVHHGWEGMEAGV